MGKVVTSQGIVEFVQTGKHETVTNHKPGQSNDAPTLEVKKDAAPLDVKPAGEATSKMAAAEAKADPKPEDHDEPLTDEEKSLPEKAQKEIQRSKRAVAKKHAEMMEARQDADANDRLAEQQYNERRLAEQRADAAERRLQELESKAQTAPVEQAKPTADDKNADGSWKYRDAAGNVDWDKYTDAKADFAADQKLRERDAQQAEERQTAERGARIAKIKANTDEFRKDNPDFDRVMSGLSGTPADMAPSFVLRYIEESDHSAGVAYFLAKNPAESQRIAKLSPIAGIRELGKIEDSLVKPSQAANESPAAQGATHKPGAPPPPITPLSGSGNGAVNTDPSKMTYKELRAYHRARAREKH